MPDQPLPTPGREPVTEQVIADLRERTEQGIRTYGRPLETHNGRDALRDAYEEALDLAQYLKQRLMEDDVLREVARAAQDYVTQMDRINGRESWATAKEVNHLGDLWKRLRETLKPLDGVDL